MDDAGAVGVARERLERKRQEAYRSRAAATVKIQRWYRQCRESRGGVRSRDSEIDSASNQLEKCAKSPKASNSAVLDQESQGRTHTTTLTGNRLLNLLHLSSDTIVFLAAAPTDVNARSLNRPGVLSQSRSGRSTATVPQQQRNRFNEFVNSEVAIAMAMMDDSYESKLNDAQRKRVERLKAYRNNPEQPQPIKSPEVVPQRAPARAPNIISTKKRTQVVPNDSSKSPQAMSPQLPPVAAENSVRETSFPEKANSTLKRPLHVLQKGHAAKQDNDMISRRTAEDKGTAHTHRLVKEHGSTWQNGTNQLNNGNNKKLSKPTSYFKGQRAMKGQRDVRKQRQTKDEGQIEQQRLKDASHVMQLTPPIKDLVKIDNETTIESVNGHKLNKLTEVEVVTHAHIQPTDSTEHSRNVSREEEANIKLPETTRSVNTYKDHEEYSEREGKALHESQQKFVTEKTSSDTSMNEPTSAAPQLCSQSSCTPLREARTESETQATDAGVHRADKESIQETSLWKVQQNEVRFTSKDMSTNTIPRVASEDIQEQHPSELKQRRQEDTELEPLKRSSATTELTVAQEVREEMQSLRDASLPKRSQASQGIKTHSVMTQTRQLVSAFVQTEGESDSDSCYSSPKHPTRRHPCAQPPHSQAISQLHNGHTTQGGYALAYAKKRESNKKRAIKVGASVMLSTRVAIWVSCT